MSNTKQSLYETSGEGDFEQEDIVLMKSAHGWQARCLLCPFDGNIFPERVTAHFDSILHLRASHGIAFPSDWHKA